ncbi:unnamed protein product, partial [Ixodes pacificus]
SPCSLDPDVLADGCLVVDLLPVLHTLHGRPVVLGLTLVLHEASLLPGLVEVLQLLLFELGISHDLLNVSHLVVHSSLLLLGGQLFFFHLFQGPLSPLRVWSHLDEEFGRLRPLGKQGGRDGRSSHVVKLADQCIHRVQVLGQLQRK